ncbi:MAG: autotransporter-associated beta strand repeat-containing protein [Pirellulales bacterium]|nr:autotransporter-associated beta strand repeat-containing protein [Pirellulales bacterium]
MSYPAIYNAQTNFLVNYKTSLNLAHVLHEGDITNNNTAVQWSNASTAMQILEAGGVNYTMAPGNHDYGANGGMENRSSLMVNYFPVSRLDDQSSFGGVYPAEPTSPLNSYSFFSAGGKDYLALALEFGPRDAVLDWADSVLKANPTRQAMIVTHAYTYSDSTRYDWAAKGTSQSWNPHAYTGAAPDCNDGEEMWQALKDNPNLKFVFNGHVLNDGTGSVLSTADDGHLVHQMLANYQFMTNGGNGYMRLLEFLPDGDTVRVRTYSPYLDAYLTTADQDFTISLSTIPLAPPLQYHAVAANLVAGGVAIPSSNTFTDLTVTQSGTPTVGTLQVNRGDYEISVAGEGLTYAQGVLLASVTQNIRDGVRGTVEVGRNSFSDGLLALSVTQAGNTSLVEANFNVSTAWFRFEGGWQAAHVTGATGAIASGNGVTQSMVARNGVGRYSVNLGVDSRTDGMLFTIANNNDHYIAPSGVLDDGSGWDIRVQTNAADFSATGGDKDFSFIYLPFTTKNLIGGRYDGVNDSHFASTGNFTMEKLATGQYRLTVPGQSSSTGMLILTVSREATSGGTTAPDDNFLTYEYDGSGHFLIDSFDLTGTSTLNSQDTHFVWAFVNFTQPLALPNFIWNNPTGGNWNTAANWSANTVASAPGLTVNFTNPIAQGAAVNLDAAATVGKMVFNSASDYKIQGTATLTLARGSLPANRIEVLGGNHEIAVPILMNDATQIDIAAGKTLTLSGIVGGANPLTKQGAGALILSNDNAYTGATTIAGGTLVLTGGGQIANSSSIVNSATFRIFDGTHAVNAITGTGSTEVYDTSILTASSITQSSLFIGIEAVAVPEPGCFVLLFLAGTMIVGACLRRK